MISETESEPSEATSLEASGPASTTAPRTGLVPWRRVLPPIVLCAGLLSLAWAYTVDDAFLVARYARRLAAGDGWTFVDGPATDGVTGPAWVLPGVVAALVGAPVWLGQKVAGAICALAALAWVVRRSRAPMAVTAVLLSQASFVAWAVAGLETGAATLAVTIAAMSRSEHARGAAVAALAWLRPELAAFALVSLVARPSRVAWGWALLGASSVLGFRLLTFGDVVPLAFHAKSGTMADGLSYVGLGVLFTTGIGGVWLAARSRPRGVRVALIAHVLAVAIAGGDWMPGWRLLVPVMPLYAWLVAEGFAVERTASRARSRWGWAALCAATVTPAVVLSAQVGGWREAGLARAQSAAFARRVGALRSVALVDVGWLVWESDVDVVDLGGLTDPTIARARGGHLGKQVDVAYLSARDPEVILLHSEAPPEVDDDRDLVRLAGFPVERAVAAHPWTREHYDVREVIPYREGYWYVWLARER